MTDTTVPAAAGGAASDDDRLLSELRRLGGVADPVPDGWRAVARDAFAWTAIEADAAVLVYDSHTARRGRPAGDGSGPALRSLRYRTGVGAAAVTVEIDLDVGADKVRVSGSVRPVAPHAVSALTTSGRVVGDCDPSGAYRFDELPRRPFCLVVGSPGGSVKTGWVVG